MTINEFLEARITEDEERAGSLLANTQEGYDINEYAKRMLAECAAKRALSNLHSPGDYRGQMTCSDCGDWWDGSPVDYPCATVRIVAAVYKDHPDYEQEWVPENG